MSSEIVRYDDYDIVAREGDLKPVFLRSGRPGNWKRILCWIDGHHREWLDDERRTRTTRRTIQWEGPYDEVYAQAMRYLDEDEDKEAAGKKGVLKL